MITTALRLTGFDAVATDGPAGRIDDLFFDDRSWTTRYAAILLNEIGLERRVLVSPRQIEKIDVEERSVLFLMDRRRLSESLPARTDPPVSEQGGEYTGEETFRPPPHDPVDRPGMSNQPVKELEGLGKSSIEAPRRDTDKAPEDVIEQRVRGTAGEDAPEPPGGGDENLRSMSEITNYRLQTPDGQTCHLVDFIIDTDTWDIRYIVADTLDWLQGKQIVISIEWIERIDWEEAVVFVEPDSELIAGSPEFDPAAELDREFEATLHEYYGRTKYWE